MMRELLIALSQSRRMADLMTTNRLAWSAASRFVAGTTIDEAIAAVRAAHAVGMETTLDHLGENVLTEAEAVATGDDYVEVVGRIARAGIRTGISVKLTALGLDISDDVAESVLRRILVRAGEMDPPLYVRVDMEGSAYTQRTIDLFLRVFADHPHVGLVIQSYLFRSDDDVERLVEAGAGVRLCKGAYSEPPTIAYPDKSDTDAAFIRQTARLLSEEARANGTFAAVATHDEAIIEWTKQHAADLGIAKDAFEFQMLNGVRRDLQARLVAEGYRMRIYVPYGTHWYPYFMRRLAERPENIGFMARNMLREMRR